MSAHEKDESILMAPMVMTVGELQQCIKNGEEFLSVIQMAEVEAESAAIRAMMTSQMTPYEAYLLGRTLHYNLLQIIKEEYEARHKERKKVD